MDHGAGELHINCTFSTWRHPGKEAKARACWAGSLKTLLRGGHESPPNFVVPVCPGTGMLCTACADDARLGNMAIYQRY